MEIDHEKLMAEISAPSKFTKRQFMDRCPGIMPACEQEITWWEEWLENHPNEKANAEIEYYEHLKREASEYFCHKLFLRLFLEDHSIRGIGDFYLHLENKKVTIRPVCPIGKVKPFTFKL